MIVVVPIAITGIASAVVATIAPAQLCEAVGGVGVTEHSPDTTSRSTTSGIREAPQIFCTKILCSGDAVRVVTPPSGSKSAVPKKSPIAYMFR